MESRQDVSPPSCSPKAILQNPHPGAPRPYLRLALVYLESHHNLVGLLTEVIGCFPVRKACSRAASMVAKDKGLARVSKMVTASEARFGKAYR